MEIQKVLCIEDTPSKYMDIFNTLVEVSKLTIPGCKIEIDVTAIK